MSDLGLDNLPHIDSARRDALIVGPEDAGVQIWNTDTNQVEFFNGVVWDSGGDFAALQAAITAEETARSTADTALQANIDAEATARATADTDHAALTGTGTHIPVQGGAPDASVLQISGGVTTWGAAPSAFGEFIGSEATFAGLPAATNVNDWAILTAQDGANAPGIYVWNGTAYGLAISIANPTLLTQVQAELETDTTPGTISGERLFQAIEKHRHALVTQAEWEAGTEVEPRRWSPENVKDAIDFHQSTVTHQIFNNPNLGAMNNPGTPANGVPQERHAFSYTPTTDEDVEVTLTGLVSAGTLGFQVGTTELDSDLFVLAQADRVTAATEVYTETLTLAAGVEAFFSVFAGGSGIIARSGLSVRVTQTGDVVLADIAPATYSVPVEATLALVNEYRPAAPISIANTVFDTGFDYSQVDVIEFVLRDNAGSFRQWATQALDAQEFLAARTALMHTFSNAYCIASIDNAGDEALGQIRLLDVTRQVNLVAIRFLSYVPSGEGKRRVNFFDAGNTPIDTTTLVTGIDLTAIDTLEVAVRDDTANHLRQWPISSLDAAQLVEVGEAFVHTFDNDYVSIIVEDAATGEMTFIDTGRNVALTHLSGFVQGTAEATTPIGDYETTLTSTAGTLALTSARLRYGALPLTEDTSLDLGFAEVGDVAKLAVTLNGFALNLPTGTTVLRGELLDGFVNHLEIEKVAASRYLAHIHSTPLSTLVLRQDITGNTNLFASLAEANNFPDADPENSSKYSILDQVEGLRRADGQLEFELTYLGSSRTDGGTEDLVTRWEQTSNPFVNGTNPGDDVVVGYQLLSTNVASLDFGGLALTNTSVTSETAFYNGQPGVSDWWASVAAFQFWTTTGIPAFRGAANHTATAYELRVLNAGA